MKFTENDIIDKDTLEKRALIEAQAIYSKPSTRKNRDLLEILQAVRYSHIAEQYLIDHQGFSDDLQPYKDVINPNGESVEVKVTQAEKYVPYIIKNANQSIQQKWRNFSNTLYIFVADKTSMAEYTLYGIYKWNGKTFIESFN